MEILLLKVVTAVLSKCSAENNMYLFSSIYDRDVFVGEITNENSVQRVIIKFTWHLAGILHFNIANIVKLAQLNCLHFKAL